MRSLLAVCRTDDVIPPRDKLFLRFRFGYLFSHSASFPAAETAVRLPFQTPEEKIFQNSFVYPLQIFDKYCKINKVDINRID